MQRIAAEFNRPLHIEQGTPDGRIDVDGGAGGEDETGVRGGGIGPVFGSSSGGHL